MRNVRKSWIAELNSKVEFLHGYRGGFSLVKNISH